MSIQRYRCPGEDGLFEKTVPMKDPVPENVDCPDCGRVSFWVPSTPNFIGGPTTGAQNK